VNSPDFKMEEKNFIKTGTTTVGIICKDAIVLAADKRATIGGGYVINKKMDKIIILNEDVAVTMAGMASDAQFLIKLLNAELQIKKMRKEDRVSTKEAANLLGRMVYQNIRKLSPIPGVSQFILAGKDEEGIHLYDIFPDGSVTLCKDYLASGSGSMLGAFSILDSYYKKGMSTDEGMKLAVKAINAALQRDTASGDGFDIVVVDKNKIKKVVTKEIETKLTI
jgi:proteasome beta subunit